MPRQRYSAEFKAKVALEALKGTKTINQIVSETGLHATQINLWKKQARDGLNAVFTQRVEKGEQKQERLLSELYQKIGRLEMELDWLKKNQVWSIKQKRKLIEPKHPAISLERQCDLLGLNRSTYYYQPAQETVYNEELMRKLDEQYTRHPPSMEFGE